MYNKMFVKSPLNYTGGKFKILNAILSSFPSRINTFVDLFAGGFNVGINVDAEHIICNDLIHHVIDLYRYFRDTDTQTIISTIKKRIDEFSLSLTNKEGYIKLRNHYNECPTPVDFFVLICYSFNHQIRFNNSGTFNSPFGTNRSSYNSLLENNLINFAETLKTKNITFYSKDFTEVDLSALTHSDLVYCDPPYLISNGSYNDGNRGFKDWTTNEEIQLLRLLDELNDRGIQFALSNVLAHKGQKNQILIEWSERYNVKHIDKNYSNCSYHFSDRSTITDEVLITNFIVGEAQCLRQKELF